VRPQIANSPGGMGRPGIAPGKPTALSGLGGPGSLTRAGATAGRGPTAAVNQQALANRGNLVRNNFNVYGNYNNYFNGNWWNRYSGAWRAAAWESAGAAYGYSSLIASYAYCGYGYSEPIYYDYGSNVVYEREYVYVNGDTVATQEEYRQQAAEIADSGKQTRASPDEQWLPLGVFAVIQGEQASGNDLFQLAVNRSGVIRGNYYNALSDTTLPVVGAVDKKTQRAAWTIGERTQPVFEAGYANLTKPETTMLVHFGPDHTQQWTLVRMEQPEAPQ
jgi:hypothetical protein